MQLLPYLEKWNVLEEQGQVCTSLADWNLTTLLVSKTWDLTSMVLIYEIRKIKPRYWKVRSQCYPYFKDAELTHTFTNNPSCLEHAWTIMECLWWCKSRFAGVLNDAKTLAFEEQWSLFMALQSMLTTNYFWMASRRAKSPNSVDPADD